MLSYDLEMRKAAADDINKNNSTFAAALKRAMSDQNLYNIRFVVPVSATAALRPATTTKPNKPDPKNTPNPWGKVPGGGYDTPQPPVKGKGKDGKKGQPNQPNKGKGKDGKKGGKGLGKDGGDDGVKKTLTKKEKRMLKRNQGKQAATAQEIWQDPVSGRQRCLKWGRGGKCDGTCGRMHACLYCGGAHQSPQCTAFDA